MDAAAAPQKYRQLIADSDVVKALRDKLNLLSPLAVSELRPSVLTQPGDWTACVRVSNSGFKVPRTSDAANAAAPQRPAGPPSLYFYAFFFADGAVVESRPAVIIDRCTEKTYSALPKPQKNKTLEKR
jgi:hypothetical protein